MGLLRAVFLCLTKEFWVFRRNFESITLKWFIRLARAAEKALRMDSGQTDGRSTRLMRPRAIKVSKNSKHWSVLWFHMIWLGRKVINLVANQMINTYTVVCIETKPMACCLRMKNAAQTRAKPVRYRSILNAQTNKASYCCCVPAKYNVLIGVILAQTTVYMRDPYQSCILY